MHTGDRATALSLTVIGTGYLGATHAVCMASLGMHVLGVDVDESKVERLNNGEVPFYEPGLGEMLRKELDSGRLRFTSDYAEAGAFGETHFVCVGTPQKFDSYAADTQYVFSAVRALAPYLTPGSLVVGKSTVPVGTAQELSELLAELRPNADIGLAWNPEFLREGFAVEDSLRPDRLVLGINSASHEAKLRRVFSQVIEAGTPVIVTDLPTAELVEVAANSFLATKISYINAMAEVCETIGADVSLLAEALSHDTRIGGRFLKPGLGFGGGCLPKDIRAFMHRADEIGAGEAVAFLSEVDKINTRRRLRTVELVRDLVGGDLTGVKVAALGASFKPDSDDIRDAPALDVARMLHRGGAEVTVYDPVAMPNARRAYPELSFAEGTMAAAAAADVVVLLTEWTEFREIDPVALGAVVRSRCVVDARHALNAEQWRAAGWTFKALGRP